VRLRIDRTWDGNLLAIQDWAWLDVRLAEQWVEVDIEAPFYGDTPPAHPAGETDRLWEYEVIELFLLGDDSVYLEIEMGPHGHYWVLQLHGVRRVTAQGLPIQYDTQIRDQSWQGTARFPFSYVPPGVSRANAYAMHGTGAERRYFAAFAVPGKRPDFHQLTAFGPFAWSSER